MSKDRLPRKLAAIFYADVVGYSRLTGEDEEGTHRHLKSYFEVVSESIKIYGGAVVKYAGDAVLAQFPTVTDALSSAADVQQALAERNRELPDERKIQFRIGVNLGEVIVDGDDIHGDGVNIAARLEGLAEPGGVCISESVKSAVGNKLPMEYQFLGEQPVKNIADPIRAYYARLQPGTTLPEPTGVAKPQKKFPVRAMIGVAVIALVIGGGLLLWLKPWAPELEPASVERMTYPLPDKPSIAVLPFDNLSGDPEQDYLADGLTEEIISTLSRTPKLFVIARNSTDIYKNKPTPVKEVAEEQGVRYVLEGSVQRMGDRIRINAQLIDALAGDHVWSERYDREFKDLFALQDDITHNVAIAMQVHLTVGEMAEGRRKGTPNPEAFLLAHKALWHLWRFNREDMAKARALIERAREISPDALFPLQMEGWVHLNEARYGWSPSKKNSMQSAEDIAKKALAMGANDPDTNMLLAGVYRGRKDLDQAIRYAKRTVELNPNHAAALNFLGHILNYSGRPKEAKAAIGKAMRLSPYSPAVFSANLGQSYMMLGEYDKAIAEYEKVLERNALTVFSYERLAAIYALKGNLDTAKEYAAKLLEVKPDFTIDGWSKVLFYKNTADLKRELDALRKAGLPETPPLKLPEKPSIAVLPFANMSGDAEQEYFSDGISEDIITDLSRVSGLKVIDRNSSFTYKGKAVKLQQVGKDLGVQYVLLGSVRRAGNRVRITTQLAKASDGHQLWAERYDREQGDVFALQDEITKKIISALLVKLSGEEQRQLASKPTRNFEAYDLFLRGQQRFKAATKEDNLLAQELYRQAIELDPAFGRAYGAYAVALAMGITRVWSDSPTETLNRALQLALKAVELNESLPQTHWALGYVYMQRRQYDKALTAVGRAVMLVPNYADGYGLLALINNRLGSAQKAIDLIHKAMELNPHYSFDYPYNLGRAYYAKGQYEEAIAALTDALERNDAFIQPRLFLAASYVKLGRLDDAEWEITQLQVIQPELTMSHLAKTSIIEDPALRKDFLDDLQKAGFVE